MKLKGNHAGQPTMRVHLEPAHKTLAVLLAVTLAISLIPIGAISFGGVFSAFADDSGGPTVTIKLEGGTEVSVEGDDDITYYSSAPTLVVEITNAADGFNPNSSSEAVSVSAAVEDSLAEGAWEKDSSGESWTYKADLEEAVGNSICVSVKDSSGTTTNVVYGDASAFSLQDSEATTIEGSSVFTIDTTAPEIEIILSKDNYLGTDNNVEYYSGDVSATITVTDITFDANKVTVKDEDVSLSVNWVETDEESGVYEATVTISTNTDTHRLTVEASDKVGYSDTATSGSFAFDTSNSLNASVTVSGDRNPGAADGYFTNNVTLTATVESIYLNLSQSSFTVNSTSNSTSVDLSKEGNSYTASTTTITKEGKYDYELTAVKTADVTAKDSGFFVIDRTAPVITVEYEGEETFDDGTYYNGQRTATITITEANFDASRIKIDTNGSIGNWSSVGDEHTIQVSFTEDGVYSLQVWGTDLADNVLVDENSGDSYDEDTPYSDEFVIDTTAPTVTLTVDQVRTGSYNGADYFNGQGKDSDQDTLTITITVEDANFTGGEVIDSQGNSIGTTTVSPSGAVVDAGSGTWTQSGENENTWTYEVQYEENSSSTLSSSLSVTVVDQAGNSLTYDYGGEGGNTVDSSGNPLTGSAFVLDLTAPTVSAAAGTTNIPNRDYVNSYDDDYLFYNAQTTMEIFVSDSLGLSQIELRGSDTYSLEGNSDLNGTTSRTVRVVLQDGVEFTRAITLYTVDIAGNVRVWSISPTGEVRDVTGSPAVNTPLYGDMINLYPQSIIQDTTSPVIWFEGVDAGAYYTGSRTVTLQVNELNFRYLKLYDSSQRVITVTKQEGNSSRTTSSWTIPVSAFSAVADGLDGLYSASSVFSEDGHYVLSATLTDPAGNTATAYQSEFTIDNTAPTISVSFDNNSVQNGMYYNAGRTATITIVEHNFDASLINISTNGSIGSWSSSGDVHTIRVSFTSDGTYNLSVTGQDLAGNALASYTADEFVIDMTAPVITFSNVENGFAYNDEVAPVITFSDEANFNASGVSYTLTGNKLGTVSYTASSASIDNGVMVTFENFETVVDVDDIYTLEASLTDLAGNEYSESITFSVNRFGSNFIIVDPEDYTDNDGYLTQAQDVLIQEINVSGVESELHGVTVTHGVSTTTLTLNSQAATSGYTIEEDEDSGGWAVYTYRIAAGNFSEDGRYYVVVSSTDRASNMNSSANYYDPDEKDVADAEVEFVLDTTAPLVTGLNVESGTVYGVSEYEVTFNVQDNIGIKTVEVELDGEKITVTPDSNGDCSFTVSAQAFTSRSLTVTATDLAGLQGEAAVDEFNVTTNIFELYLPFIIGAAVAVVAIAALLWHFFSKKGRSGDKDDKKAEQAA